MVIRLLGLFKLGSIIKEKTVRKKSCGRVEEQKITDTKREKNDENVERWTEITGILEELN